MNRSWSRREVLKAMGATAAGAMLPSEAFADRARSNVANGPSVPLSFGAGRIPDQES